MPNCCKIVPSKQSPKHWSKLPAALPIFNYASRLTLYHPIHLLTLLFLICTYVLLEPALIDMLLGMNDRHQVVSWVTVTRTNQTKITRKVVYCLVSGALIYGASIGKEHEFIKEIKNVGVRLMDSRYNSLALLNRLLLQKAHYHKRSK